MESKNSGNNQDTIPTFSSKPISKKIVNAIISSAFEPPVYEIYMKPNFIRFIVVTNPDPLEEIWRYLEKSRGISYEQIHKAPVLVLIASLLKKNDPFTKSFVGKMVFTAMGNGIGYYAVSNVTASLKFKKSIMKHFDVPPYFDISEALIFGMVDNPEINGDVDPRIEHTGMIIDIQ